MQLPHVMSASVRDSAAPLARQSSADVAGTSDADDADIGMPALKDVMIPVTRRESIHVDKFFTSEYVCSCRVPDFA